MNFSKFKILLLKIKILGWIKITSFYDAFLFHLKIFAPVPVKENETIIYLGENLPPRIPRMVKWLKRTENFHCVLICHKNGFHPAYSNNFFDEIVLFRNKWHLFRILENARKARLAHAFGPKSFYPDLAREFLKPANSAIKIIYDMQDVLVSYFGLEPGIKWYYDEFPHEKNMLEFSDGIVSHGLEPIAGFKFYNIKKKPKVLYFPLYCDDDFFEDRSNKNHPTSDIHIVYAGEIMDAHRDKKQFGNIQFHHLINEFTKQKIHFHVYPAPSTKPIFFQEYSEIAKDNPFFHLHKSVSQSELPKELSQYHFGIIPFFKELSGQSDYKYRYSTTLKLFNFIEAGIPTLISKDLTFHCWFAIRYKTAIPIDKKDIPHLRPMLEKMNYEQLKTDLISNREKISLKKNIHKLAEFYGKGKNNN